MLAHRRPRRRHPPSSLPGQPGRLAATATTDCRTGGQNQPVAGFDAFSETVPIARLLSALSTTPAGFPTDSVSCPSGGIVTLDAVGQPTDTANLRGRLARFLPAS